MARTLPHNADAEASILGGILLRNDALIDLGELEVDDFYDNRHRAVFTAMRNLEARSTPIDVVTVEHDLAKVGKLEALGGVAFIGELTLRVPTADNVAAYSRIVTELAQARRMMLAASEIAERGYELGDLDIREYLDGAEATILRVSMRRGTADDAVPVGQLAQRRMGEYDDIASRRADGDAALTGIPTGIPELDRKLGGWQRGVVNVLAARPAMGKSATAIATVDAATAAGHGALIFTIEDSWRAYADRVISRGSGVPATKLRQADIDRQDASQVVFAVAALRNRPNWLVDDRGSLTVQQIARAVRRAMAKIPKLGIVVIDYLQLIKRSARLDENAALDEIMGVLAALAKELDIAILLLSQLNRKLEERIDKRPQLADLRGSGGIEEKAKVVVALYRGSVYGGEPRKEIDYACSCIAGSACPHRPTEDEWERQLQALLLKNNNGPTGRVFALWSGPTLEVR